MNLLLVEDEAGTVETLVRAFEKLDLDIHASVAKSRNSALGLLETPNFDLVVCDLNIPSEDNALDHNVSHGKSIHTRVLEQYPGIPVVILSGFAEVEMMHELLKVASQADLFGNNSQTPLLQYIPKSRMDSCVSMVKDFAEQIRVLEGIKVVGDNLEDVQPDDYRLLRMFARTKSGTSIELKKLQGGLSQGRTYIVSVFGAEGGKRAETVAKIDGREKIADERLRFETFVTPLLVSGSFPSFVYGVEVGTATSAALLFRQVHPISGNLFELLKNDETDAIRVLRKIVDIQEPWIRTPLERRITVGQIRESFVQDVSWISEKLDGLDFRKYERKSVDVNLGIQHGDLHLGNILVGPNVDPYLIDFARTSDQMSMTVDPITLELSLLFHPGGTEICGGWPTPETAQNWEDLDSYLKGCPFPNYIKEARQLSIGRARSKDEYLAVCYAYCVRQLRYEVNKELATLIIKSILESK